MSSLKQISRGEKLLGLFESVLRKLLLLGIHRNRNAKSDNRALKIFRIHHDLVEDPLLVRNAFRCIDFGVEGAESSLDCSLCGSLGLVHEVSLGCRGFYPT